MADSSEIEQTISDVATDGIRKAAGDAGSMETHSLKDLIDADEYLCKKRAATNAGTRGSGTLAFLIQRIRYGGTT